MPLVRMRTGDEVSATGPLVPPRRGKKPLRFCRQCLRSLGVPELHKTQVKVLARLHPIAEVHHHADVDVVAFAVAVKVDDFLSIYLRWNC